MNHCRFCYGRDQPDIASNRAAVKQLTTACKCKLRSETGRYHIDLHAARRICVEGKWESGVERVAGIHKIDEHLRAARMEVNPPNELIASCATNAPVLVPIGTCGVNAYPLFAKRRVSELRPTLQPV